MTQYDPNKEYELVADGHPFKIEKICHLPNSSDGYDYKIVLFMHNEIMSYDFREGELFQNDEPLYIREKKHTVWVNVFKDMCLYDESVAKKIGLACGKDYVKTIEVEI